MRGVISLSRECLISWWRVNPAPYTQAPPLSLTHEPFVVDSCERCHITQQRVPDKLMKVNPAPYTQAPPPWLTNEPFVVYSCERCHITQQRVPDKLVKVIPALLHISPAPFHNSVCRRVLWQTSLRSSEFRFHCARPRQSASRQYPRRAERCSGPFIAACSFNYYYYYFSLKWIAFLRPLPCSKSC